MPSQHKKIFTDFENMTTAQLWNFYESLMDKYIKMKTSNTKPIVKVFADIVLDHWFDRVEEAVALAEKEKAEKEKKDE
jgi:hypothetical protein